MTDYRRAHGAARSVPLLGAAVVDPDGVPGNGDELFETVADGGTTIALGTGRLRRDRLDAIFRTALVIGF